MKKLISLVLALMFVFSMATVAMAVDVSGGASADASLTTNTVTIRKNYTATGSTAVSPAETFNFTIESGSVVNGGVDAAGNVITTSPTATIGSVEYTQGEAGSAAATKTITVNLPAYSAVGVYSYTVRETAGNSAGVTYHAGDIILKITVVQNADGKLVYGAVHCENPVDVGNKEGTKTDTFTNNYAAGTLAVSKVVSGNMGDQQKDFNITVAFEAPKNADGSYQIVGAPITTTAASAESVTVATSDWANGQATKTITLKHGETVTFTNIPYGVTYTVTETATDDYTENVTHNGGTKTEGNTATATIGASLTDATVAFDNFKNVEVDTGITLDSLPFVLILAVCVGAAVLFVVKRRTSVDF